MRVGTSGDVAAAEDLVREWAPQADAIAVTGLREARAVGLYDGELDAIEKVKRATTDVPVSDGHGCATCCRSGRSGTCRPSCRATSPTRARSCSAG